MRTHSHCNVPELLPVKTSGGTHQLPYSDDSKGRWRLGSLISLFIHSWYTAACRNSSTETSSRSLSMLSCAFVSLEAWTLLSTPRWVTSGTKIRQTVINRPSECSREFSTSTSLKDKPPFLLLLLNKESWFFFLLFFGVFLLKFADAWRWSLFSWFLRWFVGDG